MTEKLIEGKELREGIQNGINKLANTVKDTLGPMGNTVIIRDAFGINVITKDGVSVAEEIELEDAVENMGAELVKEVAKKANTLAGDGTTTATVLAQAIYNEGVKQIELGAKPLDFKKGMKQASIDILKHIEGKVKEVTVEDPEIKSVALISSNGDEEVASMITDIYSKLGKDAVISVVESNGMKTEYNIVQGMQFDRGYMSPYCVTDKVKMKADFVNPFIYLYDGTISEFKTLHPAMEYAGKQARPLIIVAENVQDSALRGLVINHASGNIQSAVVTSPGYGNKRVERLRDMAALFGAQVFDKDNEDQFEISDLGEMEKAEITNKDTAFIDGKGDADIISKRIAHIVSQLEFYKGNSYETQILEERLGKISSGVAMIKVGAMSREEGKELLDRVDDCKFAVKAALLEGVVDGGGIALYKASNSVSRQNKGTESYISGYKTLLEAIKVPFRQIVINAGESPEVIESRFSKTKQGYDVKNGVYVETMLESGIIDPFKVIRIALESAVSIVGTLLTSNYAVINKSDVTVQKFT